MIGYSPKLPLAYDRSDGPYLLTKDIKELTKQNLKMLLLTAPGERIMIPNFGVGLKNYLFSQDNGTLRQKLNLEIYKQANLYIPYITITELAFSPVDSNDYNTLYLSIRYSIDGLSINDELNIQI